MSELKEIPEQIKVGEFISNKLKEVDNIIIDAPTGWGKTGLAYQIYKHSNLRTLILNNSNILVNQYIDLLETNLENECVSCKGKNNYACKKDETKTPATANCNKRGCILSKTGGCEYYDRRKKLNIYPICISNYQLLFSLIDAGADMTPFDLVICDECHNIENILVDYGTVTISENICNELSAYNDMIKNCESLSEHTRDVLIQNVVELRKIVLITNSLNYKDKFDEFFTIVSSMSKLLEEISVNDNDHGYTEYLEKILCKYSNYIASDNKENFIYDNNENKMHQLVPLKVDKLFTNYMNIIAKKKVLMSATVINHKNMIEDLGLLEDRTYYSELRSKFPKENRPIVVCNTSKVKITDKDYENSEDFKCIIDKIMDLLRIHAEMNESGFIYCNSYKLCNMIYNKIINRVDYTILMNTKASETKNVLEKFLDTNIKRRLLISPSFAEGVNFNDDISRFQIIPKVPYLYLGSNRISTKTKLNKRWYINKTIENIIQVSGRSVRSETDEAVTYILDSVFTNCYKQYKQDYPIWFDEALYYIKEV